MAITAYAVLNLCVVFTSYMLVSGHNSVNELPHCIDTNNKGLIFVSTLDGSLSALDTGGILSWQIDTGPGSLLHSTIHTLELTNNGQWIRIIPSLSGSLYSFDGSSVDSMPVTAESLLKTSFRYSDELVMAGGLEVRTYGVTMKSGRLLYECSAADCKNLTESENKTEDTVVIERSTRTVRAIEARTGIERWNFSVGQHNIKVPLAACQSAKLDLKINVSAVLPDGLLRAKINEEHAWNYQFTSPIVQVWVWNGKEIQPVNLFKTVLNNDVTIRSSEGIYLGMHNKQLYIHESKSMSALLEAVDSKSLQKIPWNPIPANELALESVPDDSTALSVLYASEFVNGNGYYLYAEEVDTEVCGNNETLELIDHKEKEQDDSIMISMWHWWKEILVISVTTAIVFNIMCHSFNRGAENNEQIIFVERHVEVPVPQKSPNRSNSDSLSPPFTSRFTNEFETVSCLGKGGFGVVFEVKQKIDECSYAIKRITLPKEQKSRERVMREVRTLAKLDHPNIVRYFTSWVEHPPCGWHKEHDKKWLSMNSSMNFTTTNLESSGTPSCHVRNKSVVIDLSDCQEAIEVQKVEDSSGSSIVFENGESDVPCVNDETTTVNIDSSSNTTSFSEHAQKKADWKESKRRPHSLDITSSGAVVLRNQPPAFLYIQMQLCKKESLKEWLNKNKHRDFNVVLDIFQQIVSAVEYVHLQGLIHRDLKPSNIFFSLEGQIKVGDFGLVTDMRESFVNEFNDTTSSHGHTKGVGTDLYMSPEQSKKNYNYKVDIFALGLILFELLIPFSTEMEKITVLTALKERKYPEDFPQRYADERELLDMMLSKDPKRRPTTMGVRARPPLRHDCPPEYHFELPKKSKS